MVLVAQNFSGHGLRLGVTGIKFGDHRLALLLSLLVFPPLAASIPTLISYCGKGDLAEAALRNQ